MARSLTQGGLIKMRGVSGPGEAYAIRMEGGEVSSM